MHYRENFREITFLMQCSKIAKHRFCYSMAQIEVVDFLLPRFFIGNLRETNGRAFTTEQHQSEGSFEIMQNLNHVSWRIYY